MKESLATNKTKTGKEWSTVLQDNKTFNDIIQEGKNIANEVDKAHQVQRTEREGPMFIADIVSLTLTNFLGVQGWCVLTQF
jgi:hypothetical protein